MPIPKTREELLQEVQSRYEKLSGTIASLEPRHSEMRCLESWTVRDLLAVRLWWADRVAVWIEAGQRGESVEIPSADHTWKETPALNAKIVEESTDSLKVVVERLDAAHKRILKLIDDLSDKELLEIGVFEWAGNWPLSRWIAVNTATQYTTARTYIRRMVRSSAS